MFIFVLALIACHIVASFIFGIAGREEERVKRMIASDRTDMEHRIAQGTTTKSFEVAWRRVYGWQNLKVMFWFLVFVSFPFVLFVLASKIPGFTIDPRDLEKYQLPYFVWSVSSWFVIRFLFLRRKVLFRKIERRLVLDRERAVAAALRSSRIEHRLRQFDAAANAFLQRYFR